MSSVAYALLPAFIHSGCLVHFLEDRVETLEAVCADSRLQVCTNVGVINGSSQGTYHDPTRPFIGSS